MSREFSLLTRIFRKILSRPKCLKKVNYRKIQLPIKIHCWIRIDNSEEKNNWELIRRVNLSFCLPAIDTSYLHDKSPSYRKYKARPTSVRKGIKGNLGQVFCYDFASVSRSLSSVTSLLEREIGIHTVDSSLLSMYRESSNYTSAEFSSLTLSSIVPYFSSSYG